MTKPNNWKREYQALRDYIGAHPEIVLKPNEVSIPKDLRDKFYLHFDGVRKAVVENCFSKLPPEIELLCDNYIRIEKEIKTLLHLDGIIMPLDLSSFLHNPQKGLIRVIYNRMFDLLQGKIGEDAFEKLAESGLRRGAADLFRLGYEWWAGI